ncbi:Membrane coat complex Retromer, subunit VPS5/SNX1 [Handroanthus impetiginosus]|uniref:Membrane coat complex Retromer, subunit VPS5/SNX1 n=1 Tax=Handroanthus impetiginosus TaxID=429701 RepID=A0A2G9GJS2_9LAMI|nr:Membrane coat complex Retromer, subunit VPS5/SNX1 [Handroanthus impetiginosus]
MMGYENQGYEEAHLYSPEEQMASIGLADDPSPPSNGSKSFIDDPLSSSSQFVEIPTDDGDPTRSPPLNQTPKSSHNSINSILEPPSYAEAVFRSFDLDSVDSADINGQDHSALASPSFSSHYLKISVTDPQREQELSGSLVPGGNTYFSYLVTTFTNMPEFSGTEFNVRRRFRDFVALADRLAESYRGFFIPLRPDKSVVESQVMQKNEFVEQRRAALEKYLRRLAAHPVIRESEELRVFLEASGKMPLMKTTDVASRTVDGTVRPTNVSDVAQPAKGGRDFFWMFKELKQSVANDWGGAKPPIVEDDKEFLERKGKLHDFEQELINVSQQAESLVKAQHDTGETMGQLGLAFVKLTKFETEEAIYDSQRARAADMKNVATAAVKASRLYRELNAQTVKHLDKLHEYLGVMLAVNNAFSDRSSAFLTVQTLLSDLSSLHLRIEKLEAASSKIFGGDRSRIRKIEELRETVRLTEDAKNCALREYERIKENNRNELERLDKEKHDDFVSMLRGFIVNQAGYAEKMANVWETVAEETSGYVKT